jgi:hypothetical protein
LIQKIPSGEGMAQSLFQGGDHESKVLVRF